tara:strand:+ start:1398 stop:1538 length:141 start_codon:yes stop_codon:yes gene_type:complete
MPKISLHIALNCSTLKVAEGNKITWILANFLKGKGLHFGPWEDTFK